MYQVLLQALNNRTRKTLFHLRVCKWERNPQKTSGSKELGLSSGSGSVRTNAWHCVSACRSGLQSAFNALHHPPYPHRRTHCNIPKKKFSQSAILRHPYQGVFTRFLNPVFKHQGKISPWKLELLVILSKGKLFEMNIRNFLSSSYNVNKNDLIARVKKSCLFLGKWDFFKKIIWDSLAY